MSDQAKVLELVESAPYPMIVDALREWLARAESGELIGFAIAGITRDDITRTEFTNASPRTGRRELVAATALLHHRVVSSWSDS